MELPKKIRTQALLRSFGADVADMIDEALRARQQLSDRWKLNEQLVYNKNVPPPKLPWEGAQYFHIPLVGPRLLQRKANIVSTIASQDPVWRLTAIGDVGRAEAVEQTLQFHLDISCYREVIDRIVMLAMITNQAIVRVTFQEFPEGYLGASHTGHYAGLVWDVIHPDYFVVWPATDNGIVSARMCGHAFDQLVGDVEHLRSTGYYMPGQKLSGTGPVTDLRSDYNEDEEKQTHIASGDGRNEVVTLWDVLWRDDLDGNGPAWWRVILEPKSGTVLRLTPYSYTFPWYVDVSIRWEPGRFWAESSPAQDAQGLQILTNTLVNEYIWGIQMTSRPPVLTENWALKDLEGYEPGEYRNIKNLGKAMPVPSMFNAQGYNYIIDLIRSISDSATKTSETMTGAPAMGKESTATEQNIKFQAFQIGAADDITAMTPGLKRMILVALDMLRANFDVWHPVYRDSVMVQSVDEMSHPYTIELSGKSPADSPQLQSEQAQMLLQLAMSSPQLGIDPIALVKTIVASTNLPNKDELLRNFEQQAMRQGDDGFMAQILQQLAMAGAQGVVPPDVGGAGQDVAVGLAPGGMQQGGQGPGLG